MTRLRKCWLCKLEASSLIPDTCVKKLAVVALVCNPVLERWRWAPWTHNLVYIVSSRPRDPLKAGRRVDRVTGGRHPPVLLLWHQSFLKFAPSGVILASKAIFISSVLLLACFEAESRHVTSSQRPHGAWPSPWPFYLFSLLFPNESVSTSIHNT